jgi:hypothetical protein
MPPYRVSLLAQAHWRHPLTKRMIIVSNYELVEKSSGVFLLGVQREFLVLAAWQVYR